MTEKQAPYELKVDDKRFKEEESPSLPATTDPNAVLIMAMQKNYTPELIEKMMALQERYEANGARKAYNEAVAEFHKDLPPLKKDKFNTQFESWYTSLGVLLATYGPKLGENGLSVSFPTPTQDDKSMTVECRLSHKLGHSESSSMIGPILAGPIGRVSGQSARNPLQDIKTTFTYLRSATCEAVLGVAGSEASSVDNDGNSASGAGKMTPFEGWEIRATEVCEAARTLEDIIQWWPDHGPTIKKELNKAQAAKVYDMIVARKKELKAAEREPGENDK